MVRGRKRRALFDWRYVQAESSPALPPLTAARATQSLEDSRSMTSTDWLRRVREWVRERR